MTTLVTGADGLIASRVVRKLLAQGEQTIALDLSQIAGRLDEVADHALLSTIAADISDFNALNELFSGSAIDRVIHTAAVLPPTSEFEPKHSYDVNIGGTNNVFEASRRHGVQRVVYPTSIAVYGDQSDHGDVELDEVTPPKPFSLYGAAKLANEFAARAYSVNHDLDCRGLRICTVFGHGRMTGRSAAASAMISSAATGDAYTCPVTPSQTSAYIYVEEVAELMVQTAFADQLSLDIYCVPTHRVSLQEIAEFLRSELPSTDIKFSPDAPGFEQINRMSGNRLANDLGYRLPSFESSIRHQIDTARHERQLPTLFDR